jgi:Tfp pilus assembly protein PilP
MQRNRTWTALISLLALVLLVSPLRAEEPQDETGAGVSPSQETGARLQAVRANEFFYQSYGQADPFRVLVDGTYEQARAGEYVDVNSAKLVGVMWGESDQFALVEDGEGFGYILRVGDRVLNGRVVSIRKDRLTARLTLYGIANTVVLKLEKPEAK